MIDYRRLWLGLGFGISLCLGAETALAETAAAIAPHPEPPDMAGSNDPTLLSFQLAPLAPPPAEEPGPPPAQRLPVPPAEPPVAIAGTAPPPPGFAPGRATTPPSAPRVEPLFEGGSDSLVARAIGHAEGTRTLQGAPTIAYYGHTDPGNGVWNLGSFSYQHGADSPTAADARQLQRLQLQDRQLRQQADQLGLSLTLAERLNGLDLANQAPTTALSHYIDRLHQAHQLGLTGDDGILWARVRSFLDPDSGRWQAPGLGNTIATVSRDQQRRLGAIAQVLATSPERGADSPAPAAVQVAAIADYVISLDLPPVSGE